MFKHKVKFALAFTHSLWLFIVPTVLANEISSIFYVSKNDNDNQVHYGVRLNQNCLPIGNNPVYVYWRMANGKTQELRGLEQPAYGISRQSISGERVNFILNGFQNRGIQKSLFVKSARLNDGNCQVLAFTTINGKQVQISSIRILLSKIKRNPFTGGTIGGKVDSITVVSSVGDEEVIQCRSNCEFGF